MGVIKLRRGRCWKSQLVSLTSWPELGHQSSNLEGAEDMATSVKQQIPEAPKHTFIYQRAGILHRNYFCFYRNNDFCWERLLFSKVRSTGVFWVHTVDLLGFERPHMGGCSGCWEKEGVKLLHMLLCTDQIFNNANLSLVTTLKLHWSLSAVLWSVQRAATHSKNLRPRGEPLWTEHRKKNTAQQLNHEIITI